MADRLTLKKQTYTQRELTEQLTIIQNDANAKIENYSMPDFTDTIYTSLMDILDYVYEDYIVAGQDGERIFCVIYNKIIIKITNDSEISHSNISFTYLTADIDINDLTQIKNVFFSAF